MRLDCLMAVLTGLTGGLYTALVSHYEWPYACAAGALTAAGVWAANTLKRKLRR